ncbi:MAG: GNAT family N-acetyltransferase [Alphaproteobacteria bacterium]|nr:GNAT family N-acetyltransferase [Alphaproteobacteria bacterium]
MWWRIGHAYQAKGAAKNKSAFKRIVRQGPPPGLLAFEGEVPVGWCQLTPRSALEHLEGSRILARVDDVAVWSLSCFFVKRSHRGKGVMRALIVGAVRAAKRAGAPALEAYPWAAHGPRPVRAKYTGIATTFLRAGFREIARRKDDRPILRYEFARKRKAAA